MRHLVRQGTCTPISRPAASSLVRKTVGVLAVGVKLGRCSYPQDHGSTQWIALSTLRTRPAGPIGTMRASRGLFMAATREHFRNETRLSKYAETAAIACHRWFGKTARLRQ